MAANQQTYPTTPSPVPWKDSVKALTTNVVVLSGEQTISGVAFTDGMLVALAGQDGGDTSLPHVDNGPWVVRAGAWERPSWFDSVEDLVGGAIFKVLGGNNGAAWHLVQVLTEDVTPGVTPLVLGLVPPSIEADGVDFFPTATILSADVQAAIEEVETHVIAAQAPIGSMVMWPSMDPPTGWVLCDGNNLNRAVYADLLVAVTINRTGTRSTGSPVITGLGAIGTEGMVQGQAVEGTGIPAGTSILTVDSGSQITLTANATSDGSDNVQVFPYGAGDGSTYFVLPDLRQRFPLGFAGSATVLGRYLGEAGGSANHIHDGGTLVALAESSHTHGVVVDGESAESAVLTPVTVGKDGAYTTGAGTAHTHMMGGSTGAANPPYLTINFIIRAT
jgi:microcystin-dependent protein